MQQLSEKVAYIKGLCDGLKVDESKEGKLIKEIVNVLEEMAQEIYSLNETQEDINEFVDEMDDDLADLEDDYYGDEDEDDDELDDEDEEEEYYEVECPNCKETIVVEEDMLLDNDKIVCPNCKKDVQIELCHDCDCGCEE